MTTFLILQKLLIVFNSTLFISKKLNDNNAHKMIFLIKYVLSLRNLLKTGLKGHQMTIKYKILI